MERLFGNDRGGINFVQVFLALAVAAAGYFAWIYVPVYVDHLAIVKAVRTGCNRAYSERRVSTVVDTVLNGFREAAIYDEQIGADGSVLRVPLEVDGGNVTVEFQDSPPSVTATVSYSREIVWPFLNRQKTLDFHIEHTEDLSPIRY